MQDYNTLWHDSAGEAEYRPLPVQNRPGHFEHQALLHLNIQ